MRMKILVCGSIAYDNIMVFRGRFREHILPEKIHILNVAFLVPDLRREYGGCAGNIAYNLKLLGGDPLIMATVGEDAAPYLERLDALGLPRAHVRVIPGSLTAQAFITTDLDDNQITAFHPGAMTQSHVNRIDGALGVGSALIYAPATYADTDELVALAEVAGRHGGMYISHMRSEGNRLVEAVGAAGNPFNLSRHLHRGEHLDEIERTLS